MRKLIETVILQLCLLFWCPICQADCVYKECFCSGTVILCSNNNLQAFPELNPEVTNSGWDMDIDGNNISSVRAGSLPANLTGINLQGNPITTMDDNVFDGSVNTLVMISMSKVRFTKFPNAFRPLLALTELSITDGNIRDWNDGAWKNMSETLKTLLLDNVGITTWPIWIQSFTKLTDLSISNASFSTVPDNALDNVANTLTSLSIYNTRLTMVPKTISNLKSLQKLYIFQNHIINLTWLPQNSKLDILSLSNNYISNASHLSQALRPFNESLNLLDINYNLLTAVPDFSFLTKINIWDFSHNKIYDPDSGAATADTSIFDLSYNSLSFCPRVLSTLMLVTYISLSYNNIKVLQETDFHRDVISIDVGYNMISELTNTSFPENFGLMYLQLNNNPLTTIWPVALQRLPHLYELSLRHTQITRLPLALSYLSGLVTLDVTNCTALVCTCMESSLYTMILRPYPFSVLGNCGQTSVSDFFSKLSPHCPPAEHTHLTQ